MAFARVVCSGPEPWTRDESSIALLASHASICLLWHRRDGHARRSRWRLRPLPSLGTIRRGAGTAAAVNARRAVLDGQRCACSRTGARAEWPRACPAACNLPLRVSALRAQSCIRLFPTVWPGHPHALVPTRRSLVRQASLPWPDCGDGLRPKASAQRIRRGPSLMSRRISS